VVRDFFKIALADQPPIPFRAPPGIKLVRVNLKTGLPATPGDPKAIMEAFKPTQEPLGAVATDTEGQEGLAGEEFGQAGPPAIPGVIPGQEPGPPPPGPSPVPGNDRALTSGTGGLY
jgi:penicillin-binding protein 1A